MSREFSRADRLATQIHRELANLFSAGVGDRRLHAATVSRVEVTKDLAHAIVYLEVHTAECADDTLRAAMKARGFLRRELAHRIRTRALPDLKFAWDAELERANRVAALIDATMSGDRRQFDPEATPSKS